MPRRLIHMGDLRRSSNYNGIVRPGIKHFLTSIQDNGTKIKSLNVPEITSGTRCLKSSPIQNDT
jgi:hypothetical protein